MAFLLLDVEPVTVHTFDTVVLPAKEYVLLSVMPVEPTVRL